MSYIKKISFLICLSILIAGCATSYYRLTGEKVEKVKPGIYPAVRTNREMLSEVGMLYYRQEPRALLVLVGSIVDLPFSALADTIMLPYDYYKYSEFMTDSSDKTVFMHSLALRAREVSLGRGIVWDPYNMDIADFERANFKPFDEDLFAQAVAKTEYLPSSFWKEGSLLKANLFDGTTLYIATDGKIFKIIGTSGYFELKDKALINRLKEAIKVR